MAEIIKVLHCPPGKKPNLMQIKNDIESIEEFLEGPLATKELGENGLCALFNDIGHGKDLPINRVIQGDAIFGSCIFCRKEGDTFISLTDDEITDLENLLA